MRVAACRRAHLAVAEEFHDDARVDAGGLQQRRGGVAAVVQVDRRTPASRSRGHHAS
jgi:hypothetical protein